MTETAQQPDAFDEAVSQVRGTPQDGAQSAQDGSGASETASGGTGKGKKKSGAQRRKEAKEAAERAARGGTVAGPPPPGAARAAPIPPQAVAQLIRQLDGAIVALARTRPITKEESKEGGEVWAPILDHYFPQMIERGGIWLAPTMWTLGTYGPRILELLEERKAAALEAGTPASEENKTGADFRGEAAGVDFSRSFVDPVPV